MILDELTKIDASRFDLSKRLSLYEDRNGSVIFLMPRKSRFIMKDTNQFLERAEKIKTVTGDLPSLWISSPICSKSKAALKGAGVVLKEIDPLLI